MWNFNDVKSVQYCKGYTYRITFDDGLEGDVDFSEYLVRGSVFEPLRDPSVFCRARVEGGTIAWPTGADIAPETLYAKLEGAPKEP